MLTEVVFVDSSINSVWRNTTTVDLAPAGVGIKTILYTWYLTYVPVWQVVASELASEGSNSQLNIWSQNFRKSGGHNARIWVVPSAFEDTETVLRSKDYSSRGNYANSDRQAHHLQCVVG